MKKIILMLAVVLPMFASAQKIGHINSQELLAAMPELKTVQSKLDTLAGQYETQFANMQEEFNKKVADFQKDNKSKSKFRYILSRIFPGMDKYKSAFPFFYKHKWLLPIGWLYRLIRMIFSKKRRNSAMKEFDVVRKM